MAQRSEEHADNKKIEFDMEATAFERFVAAMVRVKWAINYALLTLIHPFMPAFTPAYKAIQKPATSHAVLITGCSSGLGNACALHLASRGYLVFAGVRKMADADSLVAAAKSMPGVISPVLIDVTIRESISDAYGLISKELTAQGAKLVALVNNAGILSVGPIELVDLESCERVSDVNVMGVIRCIREFLPLLRQSHGRVVTVGSMASEFVVPGNGFYSSTKFSVRAICDALRLEVHPQGISVSLIKPGVTRSSIGDKVAPSDKRNDNANGLYAGVDAFTAGWVGDISTQGESVIYFCQAVEHAISSRFPQANYATGIDAWLVLTAFHWLPTRVVDAILVRLARTATKKPAKNNVAEAKA
eukprot:Partr_v1_DN25853_c0_g1_i2_m2918 putative Dehydrogenase